MSFIHFAYADEELESDSQIRIKYFKPLYIGKHVDPQNQTTNLLLFNIQKELAEIFISRLYSSSVPTSNGDQIENHYSIKTQFLEYHYQKYQGNPVDYLHFVNWILGFAAESGIFPDSISKIQAYRYVQQAKANKGPIAIPENSVVFTVKLPPSLIERVRNFASFKGISISRVVRVALEDFLAKKDHVQKTEAG